MVVENSNQPIETEVPSVSVCVYCGRTDEMTVDHIPPKLWLTRPYPDNLLTVPACRRCNSSFQTNDEYVRFVVSIDLRSAGSPTVQAKMETILRSIQRPEAERFSRYLWNQMTDSTILGPDGMSLGASVDVDRDRVRAAGERMVRGLFFIETGRALSPSTPIRIEPKPGITLSNPAVQQFARMYDRCPDARNRAIGDSFSYVVAFYPQLSIWFLLLYDHFAWLATVQY